MPKKKIRQDYDIIIAGGGPAGLSMAARLGASGLNILVVEREAKTFMVTADFDGRTTAIAYGSKRILDQCGVWEKLESRACPIDNIHVADQHSPLSLDFESQQMGNNPFGYIIENNRFRAALFERVGEFKNITLACPSSIADIVYGDDAVSITLEDQRLVAAKLLIAADGRHSMCRERAGIKTRNWSYNETALVVTIGHTLPHHNLALEYFYPGGPFAVLPMTENRSSIVWTEKPETAAALHTMPEDAFIDLLKQRGCGFLGDLRLASARQLYPLRFMLADKLHAPRLALIGEAAHAMHPVAGQGFNLSVRDIGALATVIESAADLGSLSMLQHYEARRHLDHFTFMAATDALVKLFSNNFPPLRLVRQLGLGMVGKIPPAKAFFSKMAMGLLT